MLQHNYGLVEKFENYFLIMYSNLEAFHGIIMWTVKTLTDAQTILSLCWVHMSLSSSLSSGSSYMMVQMGFENGLLVNGIISW